MRSESARRNVWVATVILALVGLAISAYLSQKHIRQGFGAGSFLGRMCGDPDAGCDQVIRSRWGTVLGVPTAVWGMMYFAAVALWYLLAGRPNREGRAWQWLPILATLAGLGVAGALEYVIWKVIRTPCWGCVTTHVIALLLLVGSLLLWPRAPRPAAAPVPVEAGAAVPGSPRPQAAQAGVTGAAILIACWGIWENFEHRRYAAEFRSAAAEYDKAQIAAVTGPGATSRGGGASAATSTAPAGECVEIQTQLEECRSQLEPFLADWQALVVQVDRQQIHTLPLRSDDPIRGDPKAGNLVMVFSDFECPMCLSFMAYWRKEIEPYARNVRFVFRHFPMNTACNPLISRTFYARSCESAAAAEAARLQGGNDAFWKMHDELFENQIRPAAKKLSYAELARRIGLDPERLERDMKGPAVRDRIQSDLSFAQAVGVKGTPTVFLNGRVIPVWGRDRLWQHYLRFRKPEPGATTRPAETK